MPGAVDTCNEALSEIGGGNITSLDERSNEAIQCRRFYQTVIDDLLELHDWSDAITRVTLALVANDRPNEWAYAYAKPSDVASLRRLVPASIDGVAVAYPIWGWWAFPAWDAWCRYAYLEDNGVIYTMLDGAVLEYASNQVDMSRMPALFRRAVVYELAARLAMPIRKDRAIKGDMIQLANAARARAMSEDQNRNPQRDRPYVGDVEMARGGGLYLGVR